MIRSCQCSGNWADEVDATPDHSPQIVNWDPQQTQYQQQPPASGVYGTYAETMAVSVGVAESDYIQQQQQQMVYQQQQQQAAEAAVAQQAQQYLIPFQQPAPQVCLLCPNLTSGNCNVNPLVFPILGLSDPISSPNHDPIDPRWKSSRHNDPAPATTSLRPSESSTSPTVLPRGWLQ